MAQQDTGLGWVANSEYLVQNADAVIGATSIFGGPSYPGQPIPKNMSSAGEIVNSGFHLLDYYASRYPQDPTTYSLYAAAAGNYDVLTYAVYSGGNSISYGFLTKTRNAVIHVARIDHYSGRVEILNTFRPSVQVSGFWYDQIGTEFNNPTIYMPNFSSRDDAISHVVISTNNITKTNPGYSVACLAKWHTQNGTIINSPILISTDSEFTDMSFNDPTHSIAKLNILYQGARFYMAFFDLTEADSVTSTMQNVDLTNQGNITLDEVFMKIASSDYANIIVVNAPDPYQKGDGSGEGGGDGEEDESDDIDFTDPPSTSIGATGLLTIFCPNLSQLQSLGNYMWSTFDVDNWRKIIANPMDAILGLHTLPIPAVITGTKAVKVAGIDTTIDMNYTTVRYIPRSMGTCEIPKKWGAYLDYSPYTKISIFLPFIGFKEIDADDVMGRTIALQYMVDILTGACVAELKCGSTILYSWSGNCANEVPISGSDWRGAIASAIGIAATVAGTALVTGGATAPMAASMVASVGANSMNLKPTINRSGAISGSAGYMGQKRPYIIRSIPNLVIPADQNKFIGYPSFVATSLGSLSGYNEIASIHLEGIPATGNELSEIETLLKGGVIF